MTDERHYKDRYLASLAVALIVSLWLFAPYVHTGLPYFYDEDEAHHFNRVVNMVKEGDYNPRYFLKPSLHFYVRMPVTALSFLWMARQGRIASVQDIKTKDEYGLAGYSFTASHPAIVKANRSLSLVLALGTVALVFLLALNVSQSLAGAGAAALLTACSPAFVERSAIVGVDGLMTFLCLLAVYLSFRLQRSFSYPLLAACGLAAGLAVSSKYNAAPIALLPLVYCLLNGEMRTRSLLIALAAPIAGFLAGSPYIVASLPLFLDHVAYEMWHYGSGHEGHTAEPGAAQAMFYGGWLWSYALGALPSITAVVGVVLIFRQKPLRTALLLLFPVLFALLMIMQRVNFTRNFVVVIPFAAILAGAAIGILRRKISGVAGAMAALLVTAVLLAQPLAATLQNRRTAGSLGDNRNEAAKWLHQHAEPWGDTAVSGELQFPQFTITANRETRHTLPGASRIDPRVPIVDLYLQGFNRVVLGPERRLLPAEERMLQLEQTFAGETEPQRVVKNPEIRIYRFNKDSRDLLRDAARKKGLSVVTLESTKNSGEPAWLQSRLNELRIPNGMRKLREQKRLEVEVMSPWPSQVLLLRMPGWQGQCVTPSEGWSKCTLYLPPQLDADPVIEVELSHVHSPKSRDMSDDARRLGAAVRY